MQAKLHEEKSSQGEMLLAFKLLVYTHWCYFSNFWWHNNWTSPKPASEKTQLWDLKSSKLSGGIDSADLKNVPYQDVCSFTTRCTILSLWRYCNAFTIKFPPINSNKISKIMSDWGAWHDVGTLLMSNIRKWCPTNKCVTHKIFTIILSVVIYRDKWKFQG